MLEPSERIKLLETVCTFPVCALLGAIAAWISIALGWSLVGMVVFSLALSLTFSLSPLSGLLRGWVRRKAEDYYYGT